MKKKIIILSAVGVLGILALVFAGSKGFFEDPGLFMQKVWNKAVKTYYQVTKTQPKIQEEIWVDETDYQTIVDKPKGYYLSIPKNLTVDTSISPELIRADREDMTVVVTREWSPYPDPFYFIDNYFNNYYLNDRYIEKNNIEIHENQVYEHRGAKAQFISLTRTDGNPEHLNNYSYFFVQSKLGGRAFFRVMIKTNGYEEHIDEIKYIVNSFDETGVSGQNLFKTDFKTEASKNWNSETKELWKKLNKKDTFLWGLFVDGSYTIDRNRQWYLDLEEKVDYKFDFSLRYVNLSPDFPVEDLTRAYNNGILTELTLQISNHANDDLFGDNPNFDVYDGKCDDMIRSFARGAKEFGHPFLFRLNNEMNSDWVNYSGVAALSDPDIFVSNWRRIYDIFEEEGVDNAIWIYNPNAEDCPPAHFNTYLAYYPGNGYAHMVGMTGYNTGTYYADVYNEKWRTFDEIYKDPYDKYMEHFSDFPFIITEFASSSVGGDKAAWITDMFESIKDYPNIKAALWWSSADYDFRDGKKLLARPYWLDENEETTKAFREGIKEYKK